jgi:hypothetical protein
MLKIDIPEQFEQGIRERAAKRGISLHEAIRQLIALSWQTWADRGSTARVQTHRAKQKSVMRRLGVDVRVEWEYGGHVYMGVIVAKHPFNAKLWEIGNVTSETGLVDPDIAIHSVPATMLRLIPSL